MNTEKIDSAKLLATLERIDSTARLEIDDESGVVSCWLPYSAADGIGNSDLIGCGLTLYPADSLSESDFYSSFGIETGDDLDKLSQKVEACYEEALSKLEEMKAASLAECKKKAHYLLNKALAAHKLGLTLDMLTDDETEVPEHLTAAYDELEEFVGDDERDARDRNIGISYDSGSNNSPRVWVATTYYPDAGENALYECETEYYSAEAADLRASEPQELRELSVAEFFHATGLEIGPRMSWETLNTEIGISEESFYGLGSERDYIYGHWVPYDRLPERDGGSQEAVYLVDGKYQDAEDLRGCIDGLIAYGCAMEGLSIEACEDVERIGKNLWVSELEGERVNVTQVFYDAIDRYVADRTREINNKEVA